MGKLSEASSIVGQNALFPSRSEFLRISPANPLELDEILVNVCSRLDYKSLAAVRLLNRQWNKFASSAFRSRSQIVFGTCGKTNEADFLKHFFNDKGEGDGRSFYSMKLVLPTSPVQELSKGILETFGPSLTSFSISALQFKNKDGFAEMFVVLLDAITVQWCPNLKNLELSHVDKLNFVIYPKSSYAQSKTLHQNLRSLKFSIGRNAMTKNNRMFTTNMLTRVLDRASTLETVDLSVPNHQEFLDLAFFALYQRVHEASWPSLKSLRVNSERMLTSSIDILNHTCYTHLKYLRLSTSAVRKNCVKQLEVFLASVSQHLETLILDRFEETETVESLASQSLPSFCGKTTLHFFTPMIALQTYENSVTELLHTGDASFIEQMPYLRVLILKNMYEQTQMGPELVSNDLWGTLMASEEPAQYFPVHSIQTLVVKAAFSPTEKNLNLLDLFILRFPNLKEFGTTFYVTPYLIGNGNPFARFMGTLTQLRKLESLSLEFVDFQSSEEQIFWQHSFQAILEDYLPQLPSLQSIEINLNRLSLPYRFPLTSQFFESVFCGSQQNLTSVNLNGFQEISQQSAAILKFVSRNSGIYKLNVNDKPWPTNQEISE